MKLTAPADETSRLERARVASRGSERVLVVRLGAMGDIIHALPAITALQQAKPDIFVGWVVEERWAELLCSASTDFTAPRSPQKPLVDWIHVANFKSWRNELFTRAAWQEMRKARRGIREQRYAAALDLQGAMRSALVARFSGAERRVGSAEPREAPARMFYTQQIASSKSHVVEQALANVSAVTGVELSYTAPLLPVDPDAEARAAMLGEAAGGKALAIVNPGAGWGAKRWPAESFGAVALALTERGMSVMVNHGPGEEALAEGVRSASKGTATPVRSSIGELIALTRRAALFIGGDTGPMHLAAALRVPVVALFGPTRPERNGPYGTRSIVLRSPESVDSYSHVSHSDAGLLSVQPDEVIAAVDRLLGETRD